MPARKVMIGTPGYDGRVSAYYAFAVNEIMRLCPEREIDLYLRFRLFDSIVQRARNDLLWDALSIGVDDLVMIDDDEMFDAECFFRLLDHPVDHVGFPVRKKSEEELYNVKYSGRLPVPRDTKTGLLMVDAVGTGFVRLSRHAIETAWDRGESYQTDGHEGRWVFDIRPVEGKVRGEDIHLGHLLGAVGIQTYVDDTVTVSHVDGTRVWQGDFRSFLARLEKNVVAMPGAQKQQASHG